MINLSKKAADRFKYTWTELPEQRGDYWKIDLIMVSRYPVLFIIHEYTLFTLVRMKADFKTIDDLVKEIRRCCPWYRYAGNCTVGKNTDKRLNGSINEMKRYSSGDYSSNFTQEIESRINNCLFSALSPIKHDYEKPKEAVEKYIKGQWPVPT